MDPVEALALFLLMAALAAVPSTSVALVITRSATQGLMGGAAAVMGIVLGDLIFVVLAIYGLSALSELMGTLFFAIKYAAALYLIWFGLTLLRKRGGHKSLQSKNRFGGVGSGFAAGLFITLGDVKAIFFYVSLFPAFIELSALQVGDILVITLITVIAVGGVKLSYALAAKKLTNMLAGRLTIERETRLVSGALMLGAGAYLMVKS